MFERGEERSNKLDSTKTSSHVEIYDVYSLARERKLHSLKVKMLRDMCKNFDL